jgi:Cu/Ag efflux protein CusF
MENRMNANSLTRLLGAFILGSVLMAGCGGRGGDRSADTTAHGPSTERTSPAPAGEAPAPAASEVKTYLFHGTPTAIDSAAGTITVRHERIEGLSGEGTDTYAVADPAILKDAAVGKETHFTLRAAGGKSLVTKVQTGHGKGEEH